MDSLDFSDESELWETNDFRAARDKIAALGHAMDVLAEELENLEQESDSSGLPSDNQADTESDAEPGDGPSHEPLQADCHPERLATAESGTA